MKRLIAATRNKGKVKEIKEILKNMPFDVISMEEAGIFDDIGETGATFEENALIKARAVSELSGEMAAGDDSGLEVEYLNGAPGIYTSRFAGENASDMDKINKLLGLLKGAPFEKRKARFVCAIAVAFPDGRHFTVKGTCEGYINEGPVGENGFGYDPIFFVPEYNKTTAQMENEQKNTISHRGRALAKMLQELEHYTL